MSGRAVPVPVNVVSEVEAYVNAELADAAQYENRTPLDDSGVWTLHRLVAEAYSRGFGDGCTVQAERDRGRSRWEREATTP